MRTTRRTFPSLLFFTTLSIQFSGLCTAKSIPSNVAALKASIIAQGKCNKILKTGFHTTDDSPDTWSYCGDHADEGIVYVSGLDGALVDMDIDCDGVPKGPGDDGRCFFDASNTDTQDITSFQDQVAGYKKGIKDLNAFVHPYVVFGNVGSKPGYTNFDPSKNGIQPLSLISVICGDQMFYGIFGDTNGDDNPKAVVGEASISMATLCFGKSMNGNNGHGETDVLVLAFTGSAEETVPGADRADWGAQSVEDFIAFPAFDKLGDALIAKIGGGAGGAGNATTEEPAPASGTASLPTTLATSVKPAVQTADGTESATKNVASSAADSTDSASCSWKGHCAGATCSAASDCSGELTCKSGKCA